MELSLDDLLAGLETAQHKTSTVRLSERNVIELVNKLKQLGILGDELLHTSNGREYITREKLREEIVTTLQQAGGRIPLVDLPPALSVDLAHCERAAKEAAAAATPAGSLFQAQGELFSEAYFDSLAAEIDETLQDAGLVAIGDLARKFALGVELVNSTIQSRVGKDIRGRLEGGVIYTDSYLARIKAQLRGALRGSLAPVTISTLRKDLSLEGLSVLASLIPSLIEELQTEGTISGKLAAGGGSWIPSGYVKAQQDGVKAFYQQNGYIAYDMASKQGVSNAKNFLNAAFPDGLSLSSVFLSPAMLQQVEATVEEAVQSNSWCDAQLSMPGMLSSNDAVELLGKCVAATANGAKALAGTCVVSAPFLTSIRSKLLVEAQALAQEAHAKRKKAGGKGQQQQQGGGSAKDTQTDNTTTSGKQGGGGGGGKKAAAAFNVSDDDDDWGTGKGGKGKKGKAGKKAGGAKPPPPSKASQQQSKKDTASSSSSNKDTAAADILATQLSLENLRQRIVDLHPDIEGCGVDGALDVAIAEILRPDIVVEYERSLAAIFTAGAEKRKRLREAAAGKLEEAWHRLQLFSHGITLFEQPGKEQKQQQGEEGEKPPPPTTVTRSEATAAVVDTVALHRHALRTVALECIDALLHHLEADGVNEEDLEQEESQVASSALTPQQRATITAESPAELRPSLTAMLDGLAAASVEEFITALEAAADAVGLRLKRLDKKAEAKLVAEHAKVLQQKAADAPDAAALVLIVVPYLIAAKCGKCVLLPGKALSAGVDRLKQALPQEQHTVLSEFHNAVVEKLKGGSGGDGGDDKLGSLEEKVRQMVAAT